MLRTGIRQLYRFKQVPLKSQQLLPKRNQSVMKLGNYFQNPNHCIFSRDIKLWQRVVCGAVGVSAFAAGMTAAVGAGFASIIAIDKCGTFISNAEIIDEQTRVKILNKSFTIMDYITDNIIIYAGQILDAIPQVITDAALITSATCVIPASLYVSWDILKLAKINLIDFYRMVSKTDNCCTIIRTTAKGSLGAVIYGQALIFFGFTGYMSLKFIIYYLSVMKERYNRGVYTPEVREDDVPVDFNPLHY